MATPRFYCPDLTPTSQILSFELPEEEASHAIKSLRLRAGDAIVAFNGLGDCWQASIAKVESRRVYCQAQQHLHLPLVLNRSVSLAIAIPKGDRQRAVLEKLVEFGIHRLIPLDCQRSVAEATPSALARLRRYSLEACKQSGRNRDLDFASPTTLASLVASNTQASIDSWIAHPYPIDACPPPSSGKSILECNSTNPVCFAIGPEGGFTDEEVSQAIAAGGKVLQLGPRILRVENAVAYVCSIAQLIELQQ